MSTQRFLKGERGEYLVVLQFVLFFGFALTPAWNPYATEFLLAALAPLRWGALVLFGGSALILGSLGFLQIRDYLTPLPYPVDHNQLVQHGVLMPGCGIRSTAACSSRPWVGPSIG